jgi:hypothetical protein
MQNFDLTNVCSVELHIGLLGLALFFSQLVFELLLIYSCRLADLFKFLLKLCPAAAWPPRSSTG